MFKVACKENLKQENKQTNKLPNVSSDILKKSLLGKNRQWKKGQLAF